jgi:heme exporter protein C
VLNYLKKHSGSPIKIWVLIVILAVNVLAIYAALTAAPPEGNLGDSYRIFYVHVPSAWVSYTAFVLALVSNLLFLIRRKESFDVLAYTAVCIGLVYVAAALVTGSIWSKVAWGAYWNWDPRQTATLVLFLAYVGYLMLRASIVNLQKKMVVSAAYSVAVFFTVPMSYLSGVLWRTLHPIVLTGPAEGFKLAQPILETLLFNVFAATCLYVYVQFVLFKLEIKDRQTTK